MQVQRRSDLVVIADRRSIPCPGILTPLYHYDYIILLDVWGDRIIWNPDTVYSTCIYVYLFLLKIYSFKNIYNVITRYTWTIINLYKSLRLHSWVLCVFVSLILCGIILGANVNTRSSSLARTNTARIKTTIMTMRLINIWFLLEEKLCNLIYKWQDLFFDNY